MNSSTTLKHRKSTTIDRREGESFLLKADDELQSCNLRNNRCQRETDSEQTFIFTEQSESLCQSSQIRKMKADAEKEQENFKIQLQECQSKIDSLKSENRKHLKRIEALTEQNNRQATLREQVATIRLHYVSIVCILAIIGLVYLYCNVVSENHLLQEKIEALTEQSQRFYKETLEQKSELDFLKFKNTLHGEEKNRQSSRIEVLETDAKEQLDRLNTQMQTTQRQMLELANKTSENLLLLQQIEFGNQHIEYLESQNNEFKEKAANAVVVRLKESQFHLEGVNFLIQCTREKDRESKGVAEVNLFWGLVRVTYASQSALDECILMYESSYKRGLPSNLQLD